ncbi:N-acetyltransferase [Methylophaga sp. UBA5088]|uniref:N-acetyltransferase n=1 Tax=Methylophaga sp. UBA5088 TaxID=1946898 RepID=UPI00259CCEE7|nr:N-acetyltransferase [Methylophaga sp. UBA5088]
MIRDYRAADIDQILEIWLSASVKAHNFIDPEFWKSKIGMMRDVYIPASETLVCEAEGEVVGFYSLYENNLAAIFVKPGSQGKGLGSALIYDAKNRREKIQLTVYKDNIPSIKFYEKHGFNLLGERIDEHTGHPEFIMGYHS